MFSAKEQYQGFLKHERENLIFDEKRKRGFRKYKENYWLYQREQREILKVQLKKNRQKPEQTRPGKEKWEKEQTLWNRKQEERRKAYLKKQNLLKKEEKKYPRPQSIPYKKLSSFSRTKPPE